MDKVDQEQQREIQGLQNQDKIHTLLIKFVGVGFFALILMLSILFHIVLTQKIHIENSPHEHVSEK